jgi:pilus assembly protein Flp/PilA
MFDLNNDQIKKLMTSPLYPKVSKEVEAVIKSQGGAAMTEYGLLVALISLACVGALTTLGTDLSALFDKVSAAVVTATGT